MLVSPTYRLMALSRDGIVYQLVMGDRAYCLRMAKRRYTKGRAWIELSTKPARTVRRA